MAKLPGLSLSADAKAIVDKISAKRGPMRGGPYASLMHHPGLAEKVADLGEFLRFNSTLPGDIRELAILVTARSVNQAYEWVAHARIGQKEGLPDDVIERVRARGDLSTLAPRYAAAVRLVQHVLEYESIPQALFEQVRGEVGVNGVAEVVALAGHYRLIAGVLFAFDTPLPDGTPAPF